MKTLRSRPPLSILLAFAFGALATRLASQQPAPTAGPWSAVESALGRSGTMQPGNVIKFSFPRSDLSVTLDGVTLKPAFALGGWVAFKETGRGQAMAMGDLVVTEDEVSPMINALQIGGVQQTALHNHLLGETPHVMYMHISAHGDAAKIAQTIHDALALSKTPLGPVPPAGAPSAADIDTTSIASALGIAGKLNGVVYQVSIPRTETITEMGVPIPPSMGVATAINFQPIGNGEAAVTGDFVLRPTEVNPVILALRAHGIEVTALHSHMLDEQPRLFFMHFWAKDDAVSLARGLRDALDLTQSAKPRPPAQ